MRRVLLVVMLGLAELSSASLVPKNFCGACPWFS